ncbi:iron hydrogenase assembly protein [Acanthamoeba castellanii str. Neff]|uniref:Iron hydrogenase assembly protein n=1 Tax=Acanthamoeba castellanii (strain ATCC 30010 / Neff) TaxID=1257118 RepID=L8H633_ACACF|nr:iron hydrogenase assembly protein [Acanthamoeba castellanii str. Neff]ELR20974.1 iron hydrogenase assembly protein [Acanthamoeba castellanii str. Neff]
MKVLSRDCAGIFGAMNSGKSTLMNLISQQETSIVDSKPGTTADTKVALMEMHDLGPVKLFDTPGIDEEGLLGEKKRRKAFDVLKECNAAVVVVNPFNPASLEAARDVIQEASAKQKKGDDSAQMRVMVVFNVFGQQMAEIRKATNTILDAAEKSLTPDRTSLQITSIALDLNSPEAMGRVVKFVTTNTKPHSSNVSLLPSALQLGPDSVVFLNIPMDAETPSGRLLRPQALVQEELLRQYASTFCYRMDLKKARSPIEEERREEEQRFRSSVDALKSQNKLKLLITDSQATDVVHKWTMEPGTAAPSDQGGQSSQETVPLTTFSVMMINYMSGGRLSAFVEGIKRFETLKHGDKVLICEACNHDRIQDDIGTVQIPAKLRQRFGEGTIGVDHAFGREYQTKILNDYQLVIHCGGCMLDQQKMAARLSDIEGSGVPITNYGLLLSYLAAKQGLSRVLRPWGL